MDLTKIEIIKDNIKLRPISIEDKDDIFAEFTEEIVEYMYPPVPKDIDETIDFIETSIATMEAGYNIQLCITDKESGEFLGCVGLHRIDLEVPEFGIWLKKEAQGRKIGRTSVKMLFDFACENLQHKFYKYPVDKRNTASRKIPESLGGKIRGHETHERPVGEPLDVVVYYIKAERGESSVVKNMGKIKNLFDKYRQFILFCIVGASNTLITMGVLYLLNSVLGVNYLISSAIGYLCGVINGYLWSTFLVFKKKRTADNAAKFVAVNLVVLGVNTVLMYLLVDILGLENVFNFGALPAQAITICFTMILNFTLNKFWTFKE